MAIKIGNNNITNIYIGSKVVEDICIGTNKIWSNTIDYSTQYLTFEALEDTTFTFSTNDIQYSVDDGSTWTTLTADTATDTIAAGSTIMWKQTGLTPAVEAGIGTFSATGNFNVYGNIMSLYYGDDFEGQVSLNGKTYAFTSLFFNNTKLKDASNLILPATTLTDNCYYGMFYDCTSLTNAPELPATMLNANCYYGMFQGCSGLTTAPSILPATVLTDSCYSSMFRDCTSLITAPELPATTLANFCYDSMFRGCTSLNYIKVLFTTTPTTTYTDNWVKDVASSGTFVKNINATWDVTGVNGVPSGWTVETV